MRGWYEPLADRLWKEIQELDKKVEELRAEAKRPLSLWSPQ
jgi:hypothetical protein